LKHDGGVVRRADPRDYLPRSLAATSRTEEDSSRCCEDAARKKNDDA
jgi:hypothetical protein